MLFFRALKKLFKRKKIRGYYNSDDIITAKEKQSLIIGFSIILVPLIIAIAFTSLS
ncbi:hypothetical protein [Clostridium sp. Cult3]|mgnify:CR=1 FL=1|uniref:hypothetical protein n=1 Tax=Clostridium sp. Cult3 TaxID=2079004 RepID=UPI001F383679|nr:hypothetical protein [Clostridium sp. Cult3]